LDLHVAYGSYRAYLGFTKEQIADLIERLHQRGNRIASYCVDHDMQSLHEMADLRISCDAMEYRSAKVAEAMYEKMPVDGKPFSTRASQNTRRSSDVILRRAGSHGGGLHGILTGRKYAFAVNHNLANMVTYLITVQFFRLILATVPALFGTYTLSAVALMICGLIVDAAAVMLFAFSMPSKSAVAGSYSIMRRLEKPIAYNTANVVSACVSALTLWLGIALLQVFGVLNAEECMGLSFVSAYLLQGAVFVITWREYTAHDKKQPLSKAMLIALLGYVAILVACMFVPGLNELVGTVNIQPMILGMSLFAPVIYYVLYRILSANGLNLHK
jgi:magnesium-transporting ATPase (P-type)